MFVQDMLWPLVLVSPSILRLNIMCLLTNVRSCSCTGIHSDNNSMFELESQGCGTVVKVNLHITVSLSELLEIGHRLEKKYWLLDEACHVIQYKFSDGGTYY